MPPIKQTNKHSTVLYHNKIKVLFQITNNLHCHNTPHCINKFKKKKIKIITLHYHGGVGGILPVFSFLALMVRASKIPEIIIELLNYKLGFNGSGNKLLNHITNNLLRNAIPCRVETLPNKDFSKHILRPCLVESDALFGRDRGLVW